MMGLPFSCKLDRSSYIFCIARSAFMRIGALIHSMKFFSFISLRYGLCLEYFCCVWVGNPSYYLDMLDNLQK